jgi:hypothetical protein
MWCKRTSPVPPHLAKICWRRWGLYLSKIVEERTALRQPLQPLATAQRPQPHMRENFAYSSPMAFNSLYFSLGCQALILSRLSHAMITLRDFGGSPSNVGRLAAGNDVASAALLDEFRLPRRILFHVPLGICHLVL